MIPTIVIGVLLFLLVFGGIEFVDDIVARIYPIDDELDLEQ